MKRKEIYKDIEGYEGLYQVSNYGKVKSLDKQRKGNNCVKFYKERLLKQPLNQKGYKFVNLYKNNKLYSRRVHRLVAIAFIPNPLNLPEVNHKRGNKLDNRAWMLEWTTTEDNLKHAWRTGLKKANFGKMNGSTKLTEEKILQIRKLRPKFTLKQLADKFNVVISTIDSICKNKIWKQI